MIKLNIKQISWYEELIHLCKKAINMYIFMIWID